MALTVTQPFSGHEVGDVITLDTDIAEILASDAAAYVVRTPTPPPAAVGVADKT